MTDAEIQALAGRAGAWLEQQGLRLAVAESCTGGWLAKAVTDFAGSSGWFECGWVTYSDAAKQHQLGVSRETLAAHGAVSEAVVREMAQGALARSGADCAIAVSGIAGPGGGSASRPVGLVCFAWVHGGALRTQACNFDGDRAAVRRQSVEHALAGLMRDG